MNLRRFVLGLPSFSERCFGGVRGYYYFLRLTPGAVLANPLRAAKIAESAFDLRPVVRGLAPHCQQITLFGSRGAGTNRDDSDYDLFVVSNDVKQARLAAKKASLGLPRPLDLTVYTPRQAASIAAHEPTFAQKLAKGVVIWRNREQDIEIPEKPRKSHHG